MKYNRRRLLEYYSLSNSPQLKTKNGNGFTLVYVDQNASTDSTFDNKDLMKKYGMKWLPSISYIKYVKGVPHAWGWLIWDGKENEVYPLINKFAKEIGSQETPMDDGTQRTMEMVLANLDKIGEAISQSRAYNADDIIANAEKFKEKLAKGIGSKETMEALAKLVKFRAEMAKHRGHALSWMNTILVWLQNPNASDVRSKGEWGKMGYTPKEDAVEFLLVMPAAFSKYYGQKAEEIKNAYLKELGVESEDELLPSQKEQLARKLRYPDTSKGFKTYAAYDIGDMIKGENAEEFPENDFDWYDKDSTPTEKENALIKATVEFGKSIGINKYNFVKGDALGGARGNATSKGDINILDDVRNKGMLSTVIHETAHEIMHFDVVKTKFPQLEEFWRGRKDKKVVEQQAELCAWVVLQGLGYDNQQQHFNYMANWGMDEKTCKAVFDSVLYVANFVYNGIIKYLNKN